MSNFNQFFNASTAPKVSGYPMRVVCTHTSDVSNPTINIYNTTNTSINTASGSWTNAVSNTGSGMVTLLTWYINGTGAITANLDFEVLCDGVSIISIPSVAISNVNNTLLYIYSTGSYDSPYNNGSPCYLINSASFPIFYSTSFIVRHRINSLSGTLYSNVCHHIIK